MALAALPGHAATESAAPLPAGVKAVWDLDQAYRESTATRERVCLNGLWEWQPAEAEGERVPSGEWGWFKVPGPWPGITGYMQKDCQTVFAYPDWKVSRVACPYGAWYQRRFTVPAGWAGRRISIHAEYVNSFATVFVDGTRVGQIRFPGGDLDITSACRPGSTPRLSMLVVAMPLEGVMRSYGDTFGAKDVQATVDRRGLCGDVFLVSTPAAARLADVRVATSVRRWEITFDAAVENLAADESCTLRAEVREAGGGSRVFTSPRFGPADVKDGRFAFTQRWKPEKLWDTCTPQNMCELRLSLVDQAGRVLDAALPERFGFREFWIDGRDFYLNGTRIFLCATPFDNAQLGAAWATYAAARESMERLKSFGVNLVYTHNYGCEPGTHLSFTEVLRAADDEGMLVAFSQPHFGQYSWDAPDADRDNGYARDAAFYVRAAQSHPSVVFYAMSHNGVGAADAIDPDTIGGLRDLRDTWSARNAKRALRAAAIVRRLDPSRIIYHHSGGNLGAMYTANFYANFTPVQEMSDWFEHWSEQGVKPAFLCEYGTPLSWDWTMYRGWYKGVRAYGDALAPWELCLAEWDAQFLGPVAYQLTPVEKQYLRWEAKRFRAGPPWHRWDFPIDDPSAPALEQRDQVFALYLTDNIRAFRTWGLSGFCPWDHGNYWKLRAGAKRGRTKLKVDWNRLQRPGFSADYVDDQMEIMNSSYARSDWIPTAAGRALMRNNMPLLAYIGGKPAAFTSKDHNFYPGESVEKQLIVINDSRRPVDGDCRWSFGLPQPVSGGTRVRVETGQQARVPLNFVLPAGLRPGRYALRAAVTFSGGETQSDSFAIDVLPQPAPLGAGARIALFDPQGETSALLRSLGVRSVPVGADADLSSYDVLIVGKAALSASGPAPDISRVRAGLRVILFEQTREALEQRFGFRVEEYGLRTVFARVPDHPLLAGLRDANLENWRGTSTLLPQRLQYVMGPRHAPKVLWCGIPVTRVWRAGNRGDVASVLIEKPARGDFLPIVDGGFSLQFSPLLEYHEGRGLMLFCQMDVTGRTESDPAAEILARNILRYAAAWRPSPLRPVLYVGKPAGRRLLERAGIDAGAYRGGALPAGSLLVVGAGGGKRLARNAAAVADFLKAGGRALALALGPGDADALVPAVKMKDAEHIAATFAPFGKDSLLAGVCPADVYNREPRIMPLVAGGAAIFGDGVLGQARTAHVVFCQLAPYDVSGAEGAAASFSLAAGDAVDGERCALVSLGSTTDLGGTLGQKIPAPEEAGGTYTFSAFAKAVGRPAVMHLEVEPAGSPGEPIARSENFEVGTDTWTELHVTFTAQGVDPKGWRASLACAQDGATFRADLFCLRQGGYVPGIAAALGSPRGSPNLFADPSFETGSPAWSFDDNEQYNVRKTYRRACFLVTRLLGNLGAAESTPLLERFHRPVGPGRPEARWRAGLYLDEPEEWDDPYRFFGW
ncbi:MAG TPA: hypothetical protein VFE31_05620 [Opitutaceae bacterium]|nr:hypothetical protein [Opitutaceae bacterium]